jgi:glycosyltransferase involved in cell wall biosynthesis
MRVRYSRNEADLGLAGNFNRTIELSGSPYVVIAGDDDLYEPTFVSRLAARLDAQPRIALVACALDVINEDDCFVRSVDQSYLLEPLASPRQNAIHMLWRGYGNLMTGMFRREMLIRTMGFALPYRNYWDAMDLVFLFDVALAGDVVWTPEILIHKRRGGVSAQPVSRSFPATVATLAGIARQYLRRVFGSDVSASDRFFLAASVSARIVSIGWGMRWALVRSFIGRWMSPQARARINSFVRKREAVDDRG